MKKFLFILLSLLLVSSLSMADTGKYRILDYHVTLTPYSDGRVKMDYYQKWQVTDGHIPWITVGMPNSDYEVTNSSLAVKKIGPQSDDGSFVYIELDKDYQPGQIFEISFSIDENKLFSAEDSTYRLEFTPGWYDNAFIDTLRIQVNCFFKLDQVKTEPKPHIAKDGTIIWQKMKLAKGEKYEVKLSFPQKLYPKKIGEDNLQTAGLSGGAIFLIILGIIFLIVIIGGFLSDDDDGYSGGGIFFGSSSGGELSGSGGGGFGGSSSSCACACVSCACACACAGGGGAGCSRKSEHSCPICNPKKKDEKA